MLTSSEYTPNFGSIGAVEHKPEFALVFSVIGGASSVTYHGINQGVIGVGKPIAAPSALAAVTNFVADVEGKQRTDGFVVNDVVFDSDEYLVFKTPKGAAARLWFMKGAEGRDCVDVKLPTMLYVYHRAKGHLSIFSTLTNDVSADTPLYCAPLANTATTGSFCLGSAKLPPSSAPLAELKAGILDAVFNSLFTHLTGANKTFKGLKNYDEHIAAWKDFAKSNTVPNSRHLLKTKLTLRSALNNGGN